MIFVPCAVPSEVSKRTPNGPSKVLANRTHTEASPTSSLTVTSSVVSSGTVRKTCNTAFQKVLFHTYHTYLLPVTRWLQ